MDEHRSWCCPHSEAPSPLHQVRVEGAAEGGGGGCLSRKNPARPMSSMGQVSMRMGGRGLHPGGSVLTLKM